MKRWVCIALCVAAVSTGCGRDTSPAASAVVPLSWRPWVLAAAGAVTVPGHDVGERAAAASDTGRVQGNPLAEWLELAMEFVSARTKDPPAASRAYALVSVASFDAMVAAADAQRQRQSTSYPSMTSAVAGAAARSLAYLFPEQSALRLDERAARASLGSPAEVKAGLALGHAVAERVTGRARTDGFEQQWDGSRPPHEPRYWDPPPGSVSPPVQPLAGSWKTWILPNGAALRPPPPPAFDSPEFLAEAQEIVDISHRLTSEERRIAQFWSGEEGTPLPPGVWNQVALDYLRDHDISGPSAVRALTLLNIAMADAGVAAWDAKYAYWSPRPENAVRHLIAPDWQPLLDTPLFPAYVSGHSTYSAAAAEVLSALFPSDADTFRDLGEQAGMSRLFGGIHYRSDHVAGRRIGREIGRRAIVMDPARRS